jgi:hypothetical protein
MSRAAHFIGLLLLTGALLAPGLFAGPSLDASVFMVAGWQLGRGALPYIDVWDHKPPGIYVANLIGDSLLGWVDPWLGPWLVTVLAVAGTAILVAAALRRAGLARFSWLAAAASAGGLSHYLLSLGGGLTEHLAALPATGAVALVVGAPNARGWLLAGGLLGAAGLVSPQLAPAAAACLAAALVLPSGRRPTTAVVLVGGGVIVILAASIALILAGAFDGGLDALVTYTAAYRQATRAAPWNIAVWSLLALVFLVIGAAFGLLAMRRGGRSARVVGVIAFVWIVSSVALVAVSGRLYGHHVAPLAIPLSLLMAIGMEDVAQRTSVGSAARRIVWGGLVAGLIVSVSAGAAGGAMEYRPIAEANASAREVAARIRGASAVFVWGNQPGIYRYAEATPASRYVYLYPITTERYVDAERITGVLAELERFQPDFIIDAGSSAPGEPGFPPLLIDRPVATDGRDFDLLDPLRNYVGANYELLDTVAGWPVYSRRSDS